MAVGTINYGALQDDGEGEVNEEELVQGTQGCSNALRAPGPAGKCSASPRPSAAAIGHIGADHPRADASARYKQQDPCLPTTEPDGPRLDCRGDGGVLPTPSCPFTGLLEDGGTSLRSKPSLPEAREHGRQEAVTVKHAVHSVCKGSVEGLVDERSEEDEEKEHLNKPYEI